MTEWDVFGRILEWHTRNLLATVSHMIASIEHPVARDGIIVGGSYDPTDGTVEVLNGDTYAIIGDDGDQPTLPRRVPLLTTQLGDQYGPVGGERVKLIETQSGPAAIIHHGPDDNPNGSLVAGERLIGHRNAAGEIDAYFHHTNDGATPGDGQAGARLLSGGYHQTATKSGHNWTADDTLRAITTRTAAGHVDILDDQNRLIKRVTTGGLTHIFDDAAQEISHLAPNVTLGARLAALNAGNAAIHNEHLTTFKQNIMSQMMQSFAGVYATAMQAAGIPNAAALYAIVNAAGWVLGHVTPPTVPSGSSIVKLAN